MDPICDGCCLCLDTSAECFTTIDNPQLKGQMEKVFCFPIEPAQGLYSGVCQSCSYVISEFYQYSEKVRKNQETLNGNVTSCDPPVHSQIIVESIKVETLSDTRLLETTGDSCEPEDKVPGDEEVPTLDSEITFENVKLESFSDSEVPETTEDSCDPKDEVSGEDDVQNSDDDESYEPMPKKSKTKRKKRPRNRKIECLKADKPAKISEQTTLKTEQQGNREDQPSSKHIRMICDLCGTSAATFTKLLSHYWKEHKRRAGYVVCCNKKLFKQSIIQEHIDYHANPDVFRCEMCGTTYKAKATLARHMIFRHPSEDHHQFKCDQCPQSFPQKLALAEHMKWHVKVRCPTCNKAFFRKSSLDFHVTHKLCADRHMNEHVEIKEPRFQCKICHRLLKTERNLRNHMSWVHTDPDSPRLQCDICQQTYLNIRALRTHKLTHAEPKHECEFCGKKFRKPISLKQHRAAHTGEVLYHCEYCGIPKNCKSNLNHHIKRHHPTEWAQKH